MPEAFFLDAPEGGQRFCLFHRAERAHARVLYVHPFAEEMNKSRRMAALQARAWQAAGVSVLQMDLLGCGDSSGDFGDASWSDWLDDLQLARSWLDGQGNAPLFLWGLRAGCLLASAVAQRWGDVSGQLWWQPPVSGKPLVQQWLRLKLASAMKVEGGGKLALDDIRAQLRAEQAIDIAGYRCSAALLDGLERARLLAPTRGRLGWFELSRASPPALLPVSQQTMADWAAEPAALHAEAVNGPAFWQSTEIEVAPQLLARSVDWLKRA